MKLINPLITAFSTTITTASASKTSKPLTGHALEEISNNGWQPLIER